MPFAVFREHSGQRRLVGVHPGGRSDEDVRNQLQRYAEERGERIVYRKVDPQTAEILRDRIRDSVVRSY